MTKTYWFEVYFRVSQHLGVLPSEVIRNKFNPDYRLLIMKYNQILQAEIEESKKIEAELKKNNNKMHKFHK